MVDEMKRAEGPDRRADGVHSDASQIDAPSGTNVMHVVQSGETLAAIAEQYGTSEAALVTLNTILDPAGIKAGHELRIPAEGPGGTTEIGADGNIQARGSDSAAYTVGTDETLDEIAARFGTSVDALRRLNALGETATVQADQQILVPAGPHSTNRA